MDLARRLAVEDRDRVMDGDVKNWHPDRIRAFIASRDDLPSAAQAALQNCLSSGIELLRGGLASTPEKMRRKLAAMLGVAGLGAEGWQEALAASGAAELGNCAQLGPDDVSAILLDEDIMELEEDAEAWLSELEDQGMEGVDAESALKVKAKVAHLLVPPSLLIASAGSGGGGLKRAGAWSRAHILQGHRQSTPRLLYPRLAEGAHNSPTSPCQPSTRPRTRTPSRPPDHHHPGRSRGPEAVAVAAERHAFRCRRAVRRMRRRACLGAGGSGDRGQVCRVVLVSPALARTRKESHNSHDESSSGCFSFLPAHVHVASYYLRSVGRADDISIDHAHESK